MCAHLMCVSWHRVFETSDTMSTIFLLYVFKGDYLFHILPVSIPPQRLSYKTSLQHVRSILIPHTAERAPFS